jgi:SAM-dependent methyltransferase
VRYSPALQARLRCPACGGRLLGGEEALCCAAPACAARYPIVDGRPILIHEANSLFRIADFVAGAASPLAQERAGLRGVADRLIPGISRNVAAPANLARLIALLARTPAPRVLIVGCGAGGQGIAALQAQGEIEVVETDVALGPRPVLICDCHDLPFDDGAFDAVICQAVLEYVADPIRCVAEIHRILTPAGLIYAETPFMQQVHGGRYDFTRYTHLGHRRLFRAFEELDSGATGGPGMALAWAWQYFLWSFTTSRLARKALQVIAGVTAFWLKYLDPWLLRQPAGFDAAAGFYFLGRRSAHPLPDCELIRQYRGAL